MHIEEWKNAYMIIVDEISFAGKPEIQQLNTNLRALMEQDHLKFGGLAVVFAGDFSQLRPVKFKVLYLEEEFEEWNGWVHTFYELTTNHRFKSDPSWGNLLANYRTLGPSPSEVQHINTRVLGSEGGPTADDIPSDVTYATKTNVDRMAINDGIFAEHLKATHSQNPNDVPPMHTICIKSSNLQWVKGRNEHDDFNPSMRDLFHATVGEGHCTSSDSKTYDPMLKLYYGRPVMVNENIDVSNGIANGSMCKFVGVTLEDGVTYEHLERIRIDGYYVWSACVSQVKSLKVQVIDGLSNSDEIKFADLKPGSKSVKANIPIPLDGTVTKTTIRKKRRCRFNQFPLNCANARTIHKLQGRSLNAVVITTWDYTDNWIYVALSRVRTLSGLFLRLPLQQTKCRPMSVEVRTFMERLRAVGRPDFVEFDE